MGKFTHFGTGKTIHDSIGAIDKRELTAKQEITP